MEQIRRCEWAGPDQIYIDYHDQAVGMVEDHMAWCPWTQIGGHRRQKIEIYYKAAGIIDIDDDLCEAVDGRG